MPVHAWVGTLISFIQGSVGVKLTKNTTHLLPLRTPYLKGIGSKTFDNIKKARFA
ncbi:hypothetical protein MXB_48 [Myxobolus squamalis]|nr:hypothetical protein MXB_48 [Myxobolus squamalis]